MGEVRLVIYPNELDRLLRSPGGPVGRYMVKLAQETAQAANATAQQHNRSGRYAANFKVETDFSGPNGFTVRVRNATTGQKPKRVTSYAGPLERGAPAHMIRPRKKDGYLRFFYKGRWITIKEVHHPGSRPYWILKNALRTTVLKHGGR